MSEETDVATLIASRESACLTRNLVDKAARAVNATGFSILCDGIAADIFLPVAGNREKIGEGLRKALAEQRFDVIVQPLRGRRKKLLLADMDSTIIEQECIDELAVEVGLKEEIAALTDQAMRGVIDFTSALRQRVRLLKGINLRIIDKILATRISLTAGAYPLIATMRHYGARTVLVSGGFTLFTQKIAETVGFDEHHANILLHDDTMLTGTVAEPILDAEAKRQKLLELCWKAELETDDVMAVGDGANDIGMLQLAGSGVAFHAKERVREAAKMQIDHADLTALLYIQGYKQEDFLNG